MESGAESFPGPIAAAGEGAEAHGDEPDDGGDEGALAIDGLVEHADEDDRQQRDEVDAVEGLEIGEQRRRVEEDHRCRNGGKHGDDEAAQATGADGLLGGRVGPDDLLVNPEREQGGAGVEDGVEGGEDRADDDGGEKAGEGGRQDVSDERAVGLAVLATDGFGQLGIWAGQHHVGDDDAGDDEDDGGEDFEEGGEQHPLLSLG